MRKDLGICPTEADGARQPMTALVDRGFTQTDPGSVEREIVDLRTASRPNYDDII